MSDIKFLVKIYAKGSSSLIPREALIGDSIIYSSDRSPGIRMTVLEPLDLKVIYDNVYTTHSEIGVNRLLNDLSKYDISPNIIILTSYGSADKNWSTGFKQGDIDTLIKRKLLQKSFIGIKSPTYAAIKNNKLSTGVSKVGQSIPMSVSLYAYKEQKPTGLEKMWQTIQKPVTPQTQENTGATTEALKIGKRNYSFSIGGFLSMMAAGFFVYKFLEKMPQER